VLRYSWFT